MWPFTERLSLIIVLKDFQKRQTRVKYVKRIKMDTSRQRIYNASYMGIIFSELTDLLAAKLLTPRGQRNVSLRPSRSCKHKTEGVVKS